MNRNFYNNPNIGRDAYPRARLLKKSIRGTGSYMTQLRQNGEQFSLTTFSDQVNKLKILMDVLDKSKMAVKNKKSQFEEAVKRVLFYWNVETDGNRVLLFRLLMLFFKYNKTFLNPRWLTPLLDKV
ncbi:hypothetical protein MHBO_001348 [Bonamia ostreae]|uniref:Uncharacterized protein n=1 Tax=Bonamia ostreae TaxID=126728 RepID=A0ABV2AIM8_9EUKA